MRYAKLMAALMEKQPKCIVEIGTWNGRRALEMLHLVPDALYYGFDLFEDADVQTDIDEMNVKPHHFVDEVYKKLDGYKVQLFKGNTRETLKSFRPEIPVDFAWIDGGHSVETIRSDWENLKPHLAKDAVVLFDDYYTGRINVDKFGCNMIVKDMPHEIIEGKDQAPFNSFVQIARVLSW